MNLFTKQTDFENKMIIKRERWGEKDKLGINIYTCARSVVFESLQLHGL